MKESSLPTLDHTYTETDYTITGENLNLLPEETVLYYDLARLYTGRDPAYFLKLQSKTPTTATFRASTNSTHAPAVTYRYFGNPFDPPRERVTVEFYD